MAFIKQLPPAEIDPVNRVDDDDHIIQVHSVHGRVMKLHFELYREIMHMPGPLSKFQRELIAVTVSWLNGCRY